MRQRVVQVLDSRIGDLRTLEVQLSELGQALQMHQPEVANAARVCEVECFEAGQPLEVRQAGIGDFGVIEGTAFRVRSPP